MKIIDLLNKIANGTFNSNVEIKIDEKRTYTLDYYLYVMCGEMQGTYKELNNFLNQDVEVVNLSEHIKTILEEEKKIPEKLDYIHPDIQCSYNESELLLRIEANKDKINSIIEYLKSKGE